MGFPFPAPVLHEAPFPCAVAGAHAGAISVEVHCLGDFTLGFGLDLAPTIDFAC